ncbi:MAG TPA: FAD:protein FMN transferase [Pirellulaceae bacterium]|nr:FAD:protein FMN transferase [Pirellulaceae bacterium]
MQRLASFLGWAATAFVLGGASILAQVQEVASHVAMGVEFHISIHGCDLPAVNAAMQRAKNRIDDADAALSDYKSNSELMRWMRQSQPGEWHPVSPLLFATIRRSLEISRDTDGAFDITIGPVSKLWRGSIKRNRLPNPDDIAAALERVGYQHVELSERDGAGQVRLLKREMQLDFGGIGKGFAADLAVEAARRDGIYGVLVDASGDIRVWGEPIDHAAWKILLPRHGNVEDWMMEIVDGAVATSGEFYQSLEVEGQVYSHIVDPKTGWGTQTMVRVTVRGPDGATADAWATALSTLHPESAWELAEKRPDIEAMLIWRTSSNELQSRATTGFRGSKARKVIND